MVAYVMSIINKALYNVCYSILCKTVMLYKNVQPGFERSYYIWNVLTETVLHSWTTHLEYLISELSSCECPCDLSL